MREMKDSGIEWIGKIPNTWEIKKIRFVASIIRGGSPRPINQYLSDTDDGYNWIRIGDTTKGDKYIRTTKLKIIRGGLSSTRFVKQNTLLLTNSMSYGEPYILKTNGCIHDGWLAFYNYIGIDKLFLYYSLLSESVRNQFAVSVNGSVVVNLNIEKVKNAYIVLPDLRKQQAIADFLDAKCADIDSLIDDIQKQIETLKEYKKSVITQAVTKGLDPNVEMKNSGIEWLGRIPKTWKMSKIKFVSITRNSKEKYDNSYDVYIGLENVIGFTDNIIKTDTVYPNNIYDTCKKGDVLFSKLRPYLGKVIISPRNCFCTGEFMCFYNFYGDARYLKYWMRNQQFIKEVDMSTYGTKMPRANPNFILNMPIAIPERAEQKVIADFLDTKCADIDAAIEEKQKQLDVLKEYKKSLIYEYVTGKKEVPRHE